MGAPTSYLNQAAVLQVLGRHAFSKMGALKLTGWLAETEQKFRIVLYVADTSVNASWTQTCIRQVNSNTFLLSQSDSLQFGVRLNQALLFLLIGSNLYSRRIAY